MRRTRPAVVIASAEAQLRAALGILPSDPASWMHWAREDLVPHVSKYVTFSRCIVLVAGAIARAASEDSRTSTRS